MAGKSHSFEDLLDFTLKRMESMKKEGVRWVSVDPQWLQPLDPSSFSWTPSPTVTTEASVEKESSHAKSVSFTKTLDNNRSHTTQKDFSGTGAVGNPEQSSRPAPMASKQAAPANSAPKAAPSGRVGSPISEAPLTGEDLSEAFQRLQEEAMQCQKCPHLAESRRNVVFGVGNINADLMFVGEAPGMDEDKQGEPFVGKAGQLLTKIIEAMGLSREEVYIGNALKCRPDTPGQAYGNRKPAPDEISNCLPFIEKQIELIRPKALVALGASAVEALFGEKVYITRIRGQRRDYRGIPLMPTFHPSYLLRNSSHAVKRLVWEDMLQVMEILGMPISEKQQGYFKK